MKLTWVKFKSKGMKRVHGCYGLSSSNFFFSRCGLVVWKEDIEKQGEKEDFDRENLCKVCLNSEKSDEEETKKWF